MYLNGMGWRGIERVSDIHHTTVMHWIREAGHEVRDTAESEEIPEMTDRRCTANVCGQQTRAKSGFGQQ